MDEPINQDNRNVEVGEKPEPLTKEVEWGGQKGTDRETPQQTVVDGAGSKHLLGTEGAPEDGSSEERVVPGAGEVVLLMGKQRSGICVI
jgi:hypothetical protein